MPRKKPEVLPLDKARAVLGRLVTRAAQDGTVTVISRGGIPAAAVVPLSVLRDAGREP
jgi:prevent-host-death family protein